MWPSRDVRKIVMIVLNYALKSQDERANGSFGVRSPDKEGGGWEGSEIRTGDRIKVTTTVERWQRNDVSSSWQWAAKQIDEENWREVEGRANESKKKRSETVAHTRKHGKDVNRIVQLGTRKVMPNNMNVFARIDSVLQPIVMGTNDVAKQRLNRSDNDKWWWDVSWMADEDKSKQSEMTEWEWCDAMIWWESVKEKRRRWQWWWWVELRWWEKIRAGLQQIAVIPFPSVQMNLNAANWRTVQGAVDVQCNVGWPDLHDSSTKRRVVNYYIEYFDWVVNGEWMCDDWLHVIRMIVNLNGLRKAHDLDEDENKDEMLRFWLYWAAEMKRKKNEWKEDEEDRWKRKRSN